MFKKFLITALFFIMTITLSCSDDNDTIIGSADTTPPAAIVDLSAGSPAGTTITLSWTAPGDDGSVGKARQYDIRYATSLITAGNFESANQVAGVPAPRVVGFSESFTVGGLLSNTTYYFAVRTADEMPNWSEISNVDSATTLLAGTWQIYNTTNSGLLSDTIYDIAFQGANKYFGTTSGLALFDGTGWNVFDTSNSDIAGDFINTVTVSNSGTGIWIGTPNDGASLFDGTTFTNYNIDSSGVFANDSSSGLTVNAVHSIVIKGFDVWFGTSGGGICRLVDTTFANYWLYYNTSTTNIGNNGIITMAFDNNEKLWVSTNIGGVSRLDNDFSFNFTNYSIIGGSLYNAVWSIVPDNAGNIWFGTNKGISVYSGNSFDTTYNVSNSGLVDDIVTSIAIDLSGNKWFGTQFGLSRFDGTGWTTYTTDNSGLPDNFIRVIKVDIVGNLWIGTNKGVAVFYE